MRVFCVCDAVTAAPMADQRGHATQLLQSARRNPHDRLGETWRHAVSGVALQGEGTERRFMRKKCEVKMKKNVIRDRMSCVEWRRVKQTGAPSLFKLRESNISSTKATTFTYRQTKWSPSIVAVVQAKLKYILKYICKLSILLAQHTINDYLSGRREPSFFIRTNQASNHLLLHFLSPLIPDSVSRLEPIAAILRQIHANPTQRGLRSLCEETVLLLIKRV